ncbi:hypothetical protein, partial [Phaeobacter sp. 11ANDIMAR09]|uniref:hypothetical protein n=1 Tax=Phaeobacter sp. 11ANDIMAR09 TaxID=1225647 RepID=UPI000AB6EBF0
PLTLQGLKRITHHTIRQFVRDSPKTETESYDYSLERAGIVQVQLASQYWVGKPLNDAVEVRRRLEGFLQQLSALETGQENASLTDLRPMIADMERLFPQAKTAQKISIFGLHVLFNLTVSEENRSTGWKEFLQDHEEFGSKAESEIVICRTFLGDHNWPLEAHKKAYEKYWSERATRSGIHAPRLFEAAMALALAERYRLAGELDVVRAYLGEAVEAFPDSSTLQQCEAEISFDAPIEWRNILTEMRSNELADNDG